MRGVAPTQIELDPTPTRGHVTTGDGERPQLERLEILRWCR